MVGFNVLHANGESVGILSFASHHEVKAKKRKHASLGKQIFSVR